MGYKIFVRHLDYAVCLLCSLFVLRRRRGIVFTKTLRFTKEHTHICWIPKTRDTVKNFNHDSGYGNTNLTNRTV